MLEGVLIAFLLLGAAYSVGTLKSSSLDQERPRSALAKTAHDALVVLDGLDGGNGTLLDVFLREAMHCAADPSPSVLQCDQRRARNLSFKLDFYLPTGGGWAISLGNGAGSRDIYRSTLPLREAVASSLPFVPGWNGTFAATELSCYQPGMDANVTLIPINRASVASATWANLTGSGPEIAGVPAATPRWWNATIPGATRAESGAVLSNVTGKAPMRGATAWTGCDLRGRGGEILTALRGLGFAPAAATVPLGGSVAFAANVAALDALTGVEVEHANVTLYEPVGPRLDEPDTWIPSDTIALDATGAGAWTPDAGALYGAHVAMLRVLLDVEGTQVEARRLAVVSVALPTGEVPIDPPYRATLQAWMADWG